MDKFQDRYRISSTRLQNWDYSWDALYFVTICTKNHQNYFGQIENGKMILSHIGVLADLFWYEIKNHSKIVDFKLADKGSNVPDVPSVSNVSRVFNVETRHALSLHQPQNQPSEQHEV